jgi:phage recombination protein Bet
MATEIIESEVIEDEAPPAERPVHTAGSAPMQPERGIQAYRAAGVGLVFSVEQKALIYEVAKKSLTANSGGVITQAEFDYFLAVCSIRGLNPLLREAHLIKDSSGSINVQVGIDGFRALAEDTGQYRGQTEPEYRYAQPGAKIKVWVGRDQHEVPWDGKPTYARVGIYRAGAAEPFWGESWIEEDFNGGLTGMWVRRPHTMLAKVAEARAARRGFPRSLSGIYSEGELTEGPPADGPLLVSGPAATVTPVEAPGAAETPPVPSDTIEGEFRVPEAVPGGQGGTEGSVLKVDPEEGWRSVKVKWLADDAVHRKVELKVQVNRGRRTLVLLDDLAVAADAARLVVGERVWVDDAKTVDVTWGKAEDKNPPIKELRAITALRVEREGKWVDCLPPADAAPEAPPTATGSAESPPPPVDSPPPPAPPAAPVAAAPLPLAPLAEGATHDLVGTVLSLTWRKEDPEWRCVLQLAGPDGRYRCVMEKSEAEAQLTDAKGDWLYAVGEKVRIVGVEVRGWLALSAITAAP